MMTKLIHSFEGRSCASVWLEAVQFVRDAGMAYNVVLGIEFPALVQPVDAAIQQRVDAFLVEHEAEPLATVASTIFPAGEYVHGDAEEVFNDFPKIFPKIRGRWDGYAVRMLTRSLKMPDGSPISPLERLVRKMRAQASRRGGMRSVYDISMDDPEDPLTEIAIYDASKDAAAIHPPCLMHLSFKLVENQVYLTVMYRTHYYIEKALGNLLGLAQLQLFVAEQMGKGFEPGPLVCHSTYALFDTGPKPRWNKAAAKELIAQCVHISSGQLSSAAAATA